MDLSANFQSVLMRKVLLVLSFFISTAFALAQQPPAAYLKAKSDLDAKSYGMAKDGFAVFLDETKYGVLSYYAAFHSAEAALELNQAPQAIELLSALKGKVWSQSEETTYLLALAYFQNNQLFEGLQALKGLTREPLLSKGYRASFSYFQADSLKWRVLPPLTELMDNQGLTAAMAYGLLKKPILSAEERGVLNQLINSVTQPALKDKVLDVVVILPFTTSAEQDISLMESTNFLLELYQGIELEVARLKEDGVAIQLHTFDSKRDLEYLNALVNDPTVLAADVILGPIYPEETALISAFAEAQKIPFIHPLSNLGDRYEERFSVVKVQKVDSKNATSFLQGLGIRRGNQPSVNQVILLSDDPALAQPVFSLMESISAEVPLLVMDSWLGYNFSNFEMLEYANFYFISNNTPKYHSEAMDDFRKAYYSKHLQFPSTNSLLGAELVYWVHANAEFAQDFDLRPSLDKNGNQSGRLTWGFNFQKVNNNSYSPVFKLESGELIPLN
jgi:hypothetical protein